jgi:Ca2+-binding EF-hand superfamily protein
MQIANAVPDEARETFDRIDENGDGYISFEEFAALILEIDNTRPEAALRASFEAIDTSRDGRVTFGELRAWLSR